MLLGNYRIIMGNDPSETFLIPFCELADISQCSINSDNNITHINISYIGINDKDCLENRDLLKLRAILILLLHLCINLI